MIPVGTLSRVSIAAMTEATSQPDPDRDRQERLQEALEAVEKCGNKFMAENIRRAMRNEPYQEDFPKG